MRQVQCVVSSTRTGAPIGDKRNRLSTEPRGPLAMQDRQLAACPRPLPPVWPRGQTRRCQTRRS